jgi:hypothetical protein
LNAAILALLLLLLPVDVLLAARSVRRGETPRALKELPLNAARVAKIDVDAIVSSFQFYAKKKSFVGRFTKEGARVRACDDVATLSTKDERERCSLRSRECVVVLFLSFQERERVVLHFFWGIKRERLWSQKRLTTQKKKRTKESFIGHKVVLFKHFL